jgi:hypothetical protein
MGTCWSWGLAALAAVVLLLSQPGQAPAHPHLLGAWSAEVPPGGLSVYEFGPGEYVGAGVWHGPFTYSVAGCAVSPGIYDLRMVSTTQGSLGLRDGNLIATYAGVVDFAAGTVTIMHTPHRR